SIARLVQAHTEFDLRHDHLPLSASPPSAQIYWNAYAAGTQVALAQLGVVPPAGWEIQAAFATRLPSEERFRRAPFRFARLSAYILERGVGRLLLRVLLARPGRNRQRFAADDDLDLELLVVVGAERRQQPVLGERQVAGLQQFLQG